MSIRSSKIFCLGHAGFTFIELIMVLVILAITLALALPSYFSQVQTARRNLAASALLESLTRQEQFFAQHKRYADDLTLLGHASNPYTLGKKGDESIASDVDVIYLIELSTSATGFALSATPLRDQAADKRCGVLSVTSKGIRRASGIAAEGCW